METFFNIKYEFEKERVWELIDKQLQANKVGYICVADGVVVNNVQRNHEYQKIVNNSLFSICDSSWIPIYLKWIYGINRKQYCGPMIFEDIVKMKKHRMIFLGTNQKTLEGLKNELSIINSDVKNMTFYELPFLPVENFNFPQIANLIEKDKADIIWIALGAPKQDFFMNLLEPHLKRGVMIGVGAAFNFFSGKDERRAPKWIQKLHIEFIFRILQNPRKQLKRCWGIIISLPKMLWEENKKKNEREKAQ